MAPRPWVSDGPTACGFALGPTLPAGTLAVQNYSALAALAPEAIAGRVQLANVPAPSHRELLARIAAPPRAAVLSGLRPGEAPAVQEAYRALGLAVVGRRARGGFVCVALAAP